MSYVDNVKFGEQDTVYHLVSFYISLDSWAWMGLLSDNVAGSHFWGPSINLQAGYHNLGFSLIPHTC